MLSVLQIAIPFLTALILLLASSKYAKVVAMISALFTLGCTLCICVLFDKNAGEQFTINTAWIDLLGSRFHLGIDGISLIMLLISNLISPFIIYGTFKDNYKKASSFYALILTMQGAMNGVFMSMDLFLYYIFWELSLVPAFFLILWWGTGDTKRITIKFFIYTLLGSLFMLSAIIILSLSSADPSSDISSLYKLQIDNHIQIFLFFCFMLAYAVKIPIFPFHSWQPETYTSAPSPVTILLSAIMLKMALYSIIRWVIPIMPAGLIEYRTVFIVLSAFGVLYASFLAWRQTDIKRLFAYASMAHVGLIAAGILTASMSGIQGGILQMMAHAVYGFGLFYGCQILFRMKQTHEISKFGGLRNSSPLFAGLFLAIVFASVSLPLTNAFPGEFLLLNALYDFQPWIAVLAGSGVIFGAVYMLTSYQKIFLGEGQSSVNEISLHDKIILIPLVILIVIFGLFPDVISSYTAQPVKEILETMQMNLNSVSGS